MSASLALIVWPIALRARLSFPVFFVGFLGFWISALVVGLDKPMTLSRFLPGVLTIPIVGTLPLYEPVRNFVCGV
jgi:hypothetical protein